MNPPLWSSPDDLGEKARTGGIDPAAQTGTLPRCRLRRVTEYVQQNLDKDLRLAELAALVSMSPYHFARLFKGSTGVPPHRFVIQQRIARARAFMTTPDLSIAQISRMVGFRTPSHFTMVFASWASRREESERRLARRFAQRSRRVG